MMALDSGPRMADGMADAAISQIWQLLNSRDFSLDVVRCQFAYLTTRDYDIMSVCVSICFGVCCSPAGT